MYNYFTIETLKKLLTPEEILAGNFGLEREGIRVNITGKLALTPHPEIFGNKLENPIITTDFSESQVEIVTPTFPSTLQAYHFLSYISDVVNTVLPEEEFIWCQSLPCILPQPNQIPIAQYGTSQIAINNEKYRKGLAEKYGTKKQLISGIHYNYSLDEETTKKLYENYNDKITYKEFKNQLYLKITRNYLRYKWLIIYLTGSTIATSSTFTQECINLMNKQDRKNDYYSTEGTSFRNASCGYKNLISFYPRYDTVEHFTEDVQRYVDQGLLSEAKELYTQIRLKPKDRLNMLESLNKDGILYLEIRTLDINPFDKCGIAKVDMDFLHLFMLYLLTLDESDYTNWQEESVINEQLTAEKGYLHDTELLKDGEKILLTDWAKEIIEQVKQMNQFLNLGYDKVITVMEKRINNPEYTYGKILEKLIIKNGFIRSQMDFSKQNKQTSIRLMQEEYYEKDNTMKKYRKIALPLEN